MGEIARLRLGPQVEFSGSGPLSGSTKVTIAFPWWCWSTSPNSL